MALSLYLVLVTPIAEEAFSVILPHVLSREEVRKPLNF